MGSDSAHRGLESLSRHSEIDLSKELSRKLGNLICKPDSAWKN